MAKSILFPSLLLSLAGALPAQEPAAVVREFGRDREPGSFHARFAPAGAGLVFLQAMDHYHSLDAARQSAHGPAEWLLLAVNGADHALRLVGSPNTAQWFPMDLATAPWVHEDVRDGAGQVVGVKFTIEGNGVVLEKKLVHDQAQRGFRLELALHNRSAAAGGQVELELLGPLLVNRIESTLIGNTSVAIAVPVEGASVFVAPQPAPAPAQELQVDPKRLSFAGTTNRFFGAFLSPHDATAAQSLTRLQVDTLPAYDPDSGKNVHTATRMRYGLALPMPAPNEEVRAQYQLYFGPKSYRVFATLADPERYAPILDVDLTSPCCAVEVPGGRPMAKLLLWLLSWFQSYVRNWGLAIVMLTILVRGLLAPVSFHMQRSMRAYGARMAVLKPKLDALKQRHADDPKAYQQAMVAFQREHKLFPPIKGCLPIFLTMPIYIGLFTALRTAYDLRQQPFVGWIEDLSLPDALFALPFWPHHFNLLPILWIAMFVWMQLRTPLPTDPQQRQMQTMMRYMPILFGLMLYNYAAALMVYMVTSMIWSLFESAIVKKILGPVDPNVAAMAPTPM